MNNLLRHQKASAVKMLALSLAAGIFIFTSNSKQVVAIQDKGTSKSVEQDQQKKIDPAAWGGNHIGKPIPEFVHGDECLFCHRNTIGATWQDNAHGVTVRHREDAPELREILKSQPGLDSLAQEIEYFLGSRHRVRFLKKEGYGKFAILNTQAILSSDRKVWRWESIENPVWDKEKFANQCAGCHTTGVDATTKTFAGFGLDCYTCHGDVNLDHTNDISIVLLSKKRRNDARVITSLCAQCHLRGGRSRASGLPYPNNFIAGDNLFQDFIVDWARADDVSLNAGDRHIWRNVRDVAVGGDESITCLNCHQIHANTSFKHRRVLRAPICTECHATDSFKNPKSYSVHNSLCEY
ncbi:MAG: multiheme c-type cytochrome [Blastocatellales bacterium]